MKFPGGFYKVTNVRKVSVPVHLLTRFKVPTSLSKSTTETVQNFRKSGNIKLTNKDM